MIALIFQALPIAVGEQSQVAGDEQYVAELRRRAERGVQESSELPLAPLGYTL